MKIPLVFMLLSTVASLTAEADVVNLMQDPTIRTSGAYTYYARGQISGSSNVDITPFTTKFFPGYSTVSAASHGGTNINTNEGFPYTVQDTGSNATAITLSGFSDGNGNTTFGKLADAASSTGVSGWVGVISSTSTFDILIDLGSTYDITQVTLNYTDGSGRRWGTGSQSIYTATTLSSKPLDSDFSLYSSGTFTANSTAADYNFTSSASVSARYVNLRLSVSAGTSATGGSYGGILNEISIYAAVPEASCALLTIAGMGLMLLFRGSSRNALRPEIV